MRCGSASRPSAQFRYPRKNSPRALHRGHVHELPEGDVGLAWPNSTVTLGSLHSESTGGVVLWFTTLTGAMAGSADRLEISASWPSRQVFCANRAETRPKAHLCATAERDDLENYLRRCAFARTVLSRFIAA